jgi:hypothetical protein
MAKIANLGDVNITFKPALPPCKGIAPHRSLARAPGEAPRAE